MEKKLYLVEVSYQAYAWAENDYEAEDFANEIVHNERPSLCVEEVGERKNPLSWREHCLVYTNGEEISIGKIIAGDI